MPLSRQEVEHVARLAHLALRSEEVDELTKQLAVVLDHVARLQSLDTSGVEPTAHAAGTSSVLRPDEPIPCWPSEDVLANAPRRIDQQFEVQAILE